MRCFQIQNNYRMIALSRLKLRFDFVHLNVAHALFRLCSQFSTWKINKKHIFIDFVLTLSTQRNLHINTLFRKIHRGISTRSLCNIQMKLYAILQLKQACSRALKNWLNALICYEKRKKILVFMQ